MKTYPFLLLTCLLSLMAATAYTQSNNGNNVVKLNLSSFAFKGFGVQYERKVGLRSTVALGINGVPTSTVSFKRSIESSIDNSRVNVDQFKFGAFVLTPEFRYYFGKGGAFHGFYLAPYGRYASYRVEGPVTYTSSTDSIRTAVFSGNLTFYSLGLMIGSSFKLSEKLYLDWWIAGASLGKANGSVHADVQFRDQGERESLKEQLDKTSIPLTTLQNEVTTNGATVTSSGGMVGIRGFGINLGFRF